jgi:subtilisin family serine protease
MDLRFVRRAVMAGSLVCASTAWADSAGWLVRSSVVDPTPATMSKALGADVTRVEHVTENLYRVVLAPAAEAVVVSKGADSFKAKALASGSGVVQSIQKNHVYRIGLNRPTANAEAFAAASRMAVAADNPPIQAPNANPARGPDPRMSSQWGLTKVQAADAWNVTRGNRDVIVAIIDTGVDYNHEDLRDHMWRNPGEIAGNNIDDDGNGFVDDVVGYDFAANDAFPYDLMSASRIDGNPGHGTHCSGVAAGAGLNAVGISGVAPNVSIMGVRFISESGEGTTADAVRAINYAVANGAKVLSNSWGGEKDAEDDTELKASIQAAQDAGVLLIFAAGNGRNGIGYNNDTDAKYMVPASYDYDAIVSIAAIDNNNALGSFSNWGERTVDLAAPGVAIMSSVPNNGYEDKITIFGFPIADWSGTSMATPHVAGAAALIWSQYPDLTAAEVKARLLDTATPVAGLRGKVKTGGMLNVAAAVR